MTAQASASRPFRILVVCTANRFRSPAAEFLLRGAASKAGLDWVVASAGVQAAAGSPLDDDLARLLADRGVLIGDQNWRSSVLTAETIAAADLVLAAERRHRSAVVTIVPAALGRTFLLKQFARLLGHSLDGADLLARARAARGFQQAGPPGADDISDPVDGGAQALSHCVAQVDVTVRAIVNRSVDRRSGRD